MEMLLLHLRFFKESIIFLSLFSLSTTVFGQPGAVDASFAASFGSLPPMLEEARIYTIAIQEDGKILAGGDFTRVNDATVRNLVRLNTDGSLDKTFQLTGTSGRVWSLGLQKDGKIVLGGSFSRVNDVQRSSIARLNPDGTLDRSFAEETVIKGAPGTGGTFSSPVESVVILNNGKILMVGELVSVNGTPTPMLARLNSDGSLDTTFNPTEALRNVRRVGPVAEMKDGKLLLGAFSTPPALCNVLRLLEDGKIDPTFTAPSFHRGPAAGNDAGELYSFAVTSDGSILVSGHFAMVNDQPRTSLARLHSDGTLDMSYAPKVHPKDIPAYPFIYSLALQSDEKLIMAGLFGDIENIEARNMARLHPDGVPDLSFYAGTGPDISNGFKYELGALAVAKDGTILAGGHFTKFDGDSRLGIVRLLGGSAASLPPRIIEEPVSLNELPGAKAVFRVRTLSERPVTYQWLHQENPIPGATNASLEISVIQEKDAGLYSVRVSNAAGSTVSGVALLNVISPTGALSLVDPIFNPEIDDEVIAIAEDADGKLLIGGRFSHVDGIKSKTLARLDTGGSFDTSFVAPEIPSTFGVSSLDIGLDNKILVGGVFRSVNGLPRKNIAKLLKSGEVDMEFNTEMLFAGEAIYLDVTVRSLADGSALAQLNLITTQGREPQVSHILKDGKLDETYQPPAVSPIAPRQSDGGILLIEGPNSIGRTQLVRRFPDGTLDSRFKPDFSRVSEARYFNPTAVLVLPDDRILVSGRDYFGNIDVIVRLQAEGQSDLSWELVRLDGIVGVMRLLRSGDVVIGGDFTRIEGTVSDGDGGATNIRGVSRFRLARLRLAPDSSVPPQVATLKGPQMALPGGRVTLAADVISGSSVSYQWLLNGTTISGATNRSYTVKNFQADDVGSYQLIVQNAGGIVRSPEHKIGLSLLPAGRLDPSFNPSVNIDGDVESLSVQGDGKVLIGGRFSKVEGAARRGVARLHPDGTIDPSFNPGLGIAGRTNATVAAILVQPDQGIVIGGNFNQVSGVHRDSLARLETDGRLDPTFVPEPKPTLPNANSLREVRVLDSLPGGKMLVGGDFQWTTNFYDYSYSEIVRLNSDGALDRSFNTGIFTSVGCMFGCSVNALVNAIAVQPDGRILLAGNFNGSFKGGAIGMSLARFTSEGLPDLSFQARLGLDLENGVPTLSAAILQPDGKIIITGVFRLPGEDIQRSIARLRPDGRLDGSFSCNVSPLNTILSAVLEPDGKILIGGQFTHVNGTARRYLARLNEDGSLDDTFDPGTGPNAAVKSILVQKDGSILVGGAFTEFNGEPRKRLVRLNGAAFELPPRLVVPAQSGSGFEFVLPGLEGTHYEVEWSSELAGSWTSLTNFVGKGTLIQIRDSKLPGKNRYYRVRAIMPD